MPRMLDLFCGRFGWSRAFAARGWECVCVDLVRPAEIPQGCRFIKADVLDISFNENIGFFELLNEYGMPELFKFDFICASSPCEQFALFGLKCFHPDPPYPELGIRLFNHTRGLCESSGVPYIMENVRSAQQFVGKADNHCGPFYMWGTGVPADLQHGLFGEDTRVPTSLPRGITKGVSIGSGNAVRGMTPAQKKDYRKQFAALQMGGKSPERQKETAAWATIPPMLANAGAAYAERLLEQTLMGKPEHLGRDPVEPSFGE